MFLKTVQVMGNENWCLKIGLKLDRIEYCYGTIKSAQLKPGIHFQLHIMIYALFCKHFSEITQMKFFI